MKFAKLKLDKEKSYIFHCPGCDNPHFVRIEGPGPNWKLSGLKENKPTVSPSMLVTKGRDNGTCHSFVKDGKIQFLNDCTHKLKGQTVEIPDWHELYNWEEVE